VGLSRCPRPSAATKRKAKKSPLEKAAGKFPIIHFSAPDVFASPSLTLEKDYAHGWQGNTTDGRLDVGVGPAWQLIRGIALPF
jgi:hypothetical protein